MMQFLINVRSKPRNKYIPTYNSAEILLHFLHSGLSSCPIHSMVTLVGQTWMQLSPSQVHVFSLKGSAFACSWYDSTPSNSIYDWYRMSMYVCVCAWDRGVEVTQMKKGLKPDLVELNLCNIWSNIYIYIYVCVSETALTMVIVFVYHHTLSV